MALPKGHLGPIGASTTRPANKRIGVDLAGALPLLGIALAAFAVVEGRPASRWLVPLLESLRLAPDPADLALGALMGLGAVIFVATALLALRRRARPWPLLLLPIVALGGAYFGAYWALHEAVVPAGATLSERLAIRGPALLTAHAIAAGGFALASLLLTGAALVHALVARTRTRDHRAGSRRIVALFLGLFALGAGPALMRALDLGHSARTQLLLGALPAALGVLAVYLGGAALPRCHWSRRRIIAGDILVAAAASILAVILLGVARSIALPGLLDEVMTDDVWPVIAWGLRTEGAVYVRGAALFAAPIALAALAVVPASHLIPGVARRGRSLAALLFIVGVPVIQLRTLLTDASVSVETAWTRQIPAGLTLPTVASDAPACADLAAEHVLFLGFSKMSLGARDLGPTSQLDRDEGAAALVVEIDRAIKADAPLRIAVDASLPNAPIDRLTRMLAQSELPAFRPESGRVRRRPRCSVEWVARGDGSAKLFPACASLLIAGDRCPEPTSASPRSLIVVTSSEVSAQVPGQEATFLHGSLAPAIAAIAAGASTPGPLAALDRRSALIAAGPDVPFGSVLSIATGFVAGGTTRGLLPSAPAPSVSGTSTPPAAESPLERVEVTVSGRSWSARSVDPVRAAIEARSEGLRACAKAAVGSAESRSGVSRVHLLIGRDGSVRSLFRLGAQPGGARVTACFASALLALTFPPGEEIVASVSLTSAVRRARLVVGLDADDPAYPPAAIATASQRIKAAESKLLFCYEDELTRDAGPHEMLDIPLDFAATRQITPVPRAAPATPLDPELVTCVVDAFAFIEPFDPPATGALHITLAFLPP